MLIKPGFELCVSKIRHSNFRLLNPFFNDPNIFACQMDNFLTAIIVVNYDINYSIVSEYTEITPSEY